MGIALLVVDLPGVGGVDDASALFAASPAYERACELLHAEVRAGLRGLHDAGYGEVRLYESRGGILWPRVGADVLGDGDVRIPPTNVANAGMFEGVDAVACLGMHAPAGARGFAAHTIDAQAVWRAAGHLLSETSIVLGLASDLGVPAIFVSGDGALGSHIDERVAFVPTKVSDDPRRTRPRPQVEIDREIERAAHTTPVFVPPVDGAIELTFRSRWQANMARRAGASGVDDRTVRVTGGRFTDAYERAVEIVRASRPLQMRAVRTHTPEVLVEDATELLCRPFAQPPPPDVTRPATLALTAFLEATSGDASWQLVHRALTLHMLEGHAPSLFRRSALDEELDRALARLDEVPVEFAPGIPLEEGMARLDALYLARERRRAVPDVDLDALAAYIRHTARENPIYAWLLTELAVQTGLPRVLTGPPRAYRALSQVHDTYWLTHLFLLETHYLARPLPAVGWETRIEELLFGARFAIDTARVDLAAEIAICLQLAGEVDTAEHSELLLLQRRHQGSDGFVRDPWTDESRHTDPARAARLDAHSTAAALVAFARAGAPLHSD